MLCRLRLDLSVFGLFFVVSVKLLLSSAEDLSALLVIHLGTGQSLLFLLAASTLNDCGLLPPFHTRQLLEVQEKALHGGNIRVHLASDFTQCHIQKHFVV
jgi:hypothetical protein